MSELSLGIDIVLILFATGLVAGMVDAMAGGGGLITLPVLLFTGLTPVESLATNKLQGSFGTFASSFYFVRRGKLRLKEIRFLVICTFVGSAAGTLLVQHLNPGILTRIIPFLLIAIALYFWFGPRLGEENRRQRIGLVGFALSVAFSVGLYDGFFGPGAGSFFAIGFVTLLGFDLLKATAHTKVLNFTSNIASLIFFTVSGHVVWSLGLVMAAGQLLGAHLGAHLALRHGSRLIRPLIVIMSITISLKLLLD